MLFKALILQCIQNIINIQLFYIGAVINLKLCIGNESLDLKLYDALP